MCIYFDLSEGKILINISDSYVSPSGRILIVYGYPAKNQMFDINLFLS